MGDTEKYLSTTEGLEFAKKVAEKLGMEFDLEGTRQEADAMYELYFEAIVRVTKLNPSLVRFQAGAFRNLNAFVPVSGDTKGSIFFDEQLDFWLLICSTLVTIMACKPIEGNEAEALVSAFVANLDVAINPYLHEQQRKRFWGFVCRHAECMPVAVPLRRAMVVFILCHEIGHILSQHHRAGTTPSLATEAEADRIAANLYIEIVQAGLDAHPIFIHPKLAAAPILMMVCFDLISGRRRQRGIPIRKNAAHSSGQARAAFLQEALAPVLQEASYVRDGFGAALDELIRLAEIPTLQ